MSWEGNDPSARGLQHFGADRCECLQVTAFDAVVAHRDRAELQLQAHVFRHPESALGGPGERRVIVIEVLALARGA